MTPKFALSVREPWAWLICKGLKDIENRDWPTKFRGRVYIHAGKKADGRNYNETKHIQGGIQKLLCSMGNEKAAQLVWEIVYHPSWKPCYGAIIGEVDIVDCVTDSDSPWFVGEYGFVLANPTLYEKPMPYKGQLGFFEVTLPEGVA